MRMIDGRKWPKSLQQKLPLPPVKASLQFATRNLLRPSGIVGDQGPLRRGAYVERHRGFRLV